MRVALNLAPERIVFISALLAAAAIFAAVWLSTQVPSLGVTWQVVDGAVQIRNAGSGPASGKLQSGQKVVALKTASGTTHELAPVDLTPEPDMRFMHYSDMDAFFARQSQRHEILAQGPVQIETDAGVVTLTPADSRPLLSLPLLFWFQLFCGVAGLMAGASVWAYRRQDPATKYYALTGFAMLLFAVSAAVYSTRELAIDGDLFKALSATNQFGALLFCGGLIAVLWYYPTRLSSFGAGPWIIALFVVCGLAIPLRLHNSVELLAHLPVIFGYLFTYVLAALQWRNTRGDPLQRAALRWFLFSWLFGSGAFVAFVMLPAMFGYDSGAIQGYAFGFFLLIYIGVAVGVLRYQLFRLDRWWFIAWGVFVGGLAVIALDLLFIYVLQLDTRASLLIAMALAGWLYFPVRQWLLSRVLRSGRGSDPATLVRMVTQALSQPEREPDSAWRALLRQVYAPSTLEPAARLPRDDIAEAGLALDVAGTAELASLRLMYCGGGARLFNLQDLALLGDLRSLFAEVLRYRERLESAVAGERDRVARDLHDDVGARLLTLSHSADSVSAERARQTLSELRAVVYSMRAPPAQISDLLGDWRAEASERCEAAGVGLEWHVHGQAPDLALAGGAALSLLRVMRETLSNALHHGCQRGVGVVLAFNDGTLAGCVSNHYAGGDPAHWRASVGLHNLRDRLQRLHGEIDWQNTDGRLDCRWSVDLVAAAQAPN